MSKKLRIVLAQLDLAVGDIAGNLTKHIKAAETARDELAADVIVFPELSLTSYPPEDLLLRKSFIAETNAALEKMLSTIQNIYCLIGHPLATNEGLYNACSLIYNGKIIARYAKQCLPNYSVFDEYRYFIPDNRASVPLIHDVPVGLIICEDLWHTNPTQQAVEQGARLILCMNASPFETNKHEERVANLTTRAQENRVPILYANLVGGQDEIVFDGGSMCVNATGNICEFAGFFQEKLLPIDITIDDHETKIIAAPVKEPPQSVERVYQCLVLGLRDYIEKNHFPGVIVGVSGGIDSALTLAIAVDALSKDRVHAVTMPSPYTAEISNEDAELLAKNLGVALEKVSIESVYQNFLSLLAPSFVNKKPDVTEENIQARCRAIILMALSNKSGRLVLTTGNRSELAVGYCTLYGDMAGGFAVLKDIPKTLVYALAKYRNQLLPVIPTRTLERAPTAELSPNQKDEDSLPPYSILDKILECYLNQDLGIDEIIALGFDRETVVKVISLVRHSEYKRRQAAIGTRINLKSFGKDWRYPITNGFRK